MRIKSKNTPPFSRLSLLKAGLFALLLPCALFSQTAPGLPDPLIPPAQPSYTTVGAACSAGVSAVREKRWAAAMAAFQAAMSLTPDPGVKAKIQKWVDYVQNQQATQVSSPEASQVPAASPTPAASPKYQGSRWDISIAVGGDNPGLNWQSAYVTGPCFDLSLETRLQEGLYVGLNVEVAGFTGLNYTGGIDDDEIRILPEVQYRLNLGFLRPYALADLGYVMEDMKGEAVKNDDVVNLNPDAAVGVGLGLGLSEATDLYLAVKMNFLFTSQVMGIDTPVVAGIRFGV